MHEASEVGTHRRTNSSFSSCRRYSLTWTWISLGCFQPSPSHEWSEKFALAISLSIPYVYILPCCRIFLVLRTVERNSLAAGNHWAEQTNTRHQLMRNVNTTRYGDESIAGGRERECASLLVLSGISQIIQSHYWINASAVIGRVKFNWIPWWDIMDGAKTHRNCADANMQSNMAIHSLDSNRHHPVFFQGLGTREFVLMSLMSILLIELMCIFHFMITPKS
jgi:hypothetical protein